MVLQGTILERTLGSDVMTTDVVTGANGIARQRAVVLRIFPS